MEDELLDPRTGNPEIEWGVDFALEVRRARCLAVLEKF